MKNTVKWSKKAWIAAAAVILVLILAAAAFVLNGKRDAFRSVQVYTVEGDVTIFRADIGEIAAYENLYLESGDSVSVPEGGLLRLKLDDDKYIIAEENTVFRLIAEGSAKDSRTSLELERGAVINEIEHPLSPASSYEVTTPNSVMAVRGTCFRTEVAAIGEEIFTKLCTFEGVVASRLKQPDGSLADNEVTVTEGREITVVGNSKEAHYQAEVDLIDYENLPAQTLEILMYILERGRILEISQSELADLIEQITILEKEIMSDGLSRVEDGGNRQSPQEGAGTDSPASGGDGRNRQPSQEGAGTDSPAQGGGRNRQPSQPDRRTDSLTPGGDGRNPQPSQLNTGAGSPSREEDEQERQPSQESAGTDGSPQGGGGHNQQQTETGTHNVTFLYQGEVFGTQEVVHGAYIQKPSLAPAATGKWDYDFSKPAAADVNIVWVTE